MIGAEELVKRAIEKYDMPSPKNKILVGFSGGSDSVCLMSILYELGYEITACHLNHNMRETAMRDMLFCKEFCEKRNIPFVSKIAEKGSIKSEAQARKVRYAFFDEVMQERGIETLATAHNKNDSAETVLLNLLRGSALDGLCGISPADAKVIRPLIMVTKSQVLEYIEEKKLDYMTDESNLTDIYTRNKIRHKIIPLLEEEFNRSFIDTVAENAELMRYDREYLWDAAYKSFDEIKQGDGILCDRLNALPRAISGRVIQILWKQATDSGQNLPRKYAEAVLKLAIAAKTASSIDLPQGFSARVEYNRLFVAKRPKQTEFFADIRIGEFTDLEEIGIRVGIFEEGGGLLISLDGTETLSVRTKRSGDSFRPSGMSGTKTLSDYFTDKKIPHDMRMKTPVLLADGRIAAVGDMRADELFAKGKRAKNYYLKIEKN